AFPHYDKVFGLESRVGGGARLGYLFTEVVGAELDVGYQDLRPSTGATSPSLTLGGASLSLNFGNARHLFYLLGGYTRLDFEKTAPKSRRVYPPRRENRWVHPPRFREDGAVPLHRRRGARRDRRTAVSG